MNQNHINQTSSLKKYKSSPSIAGKTLQIDIEFDRILAFMGPNGSGKTSLLRNIANSPGNLCPPNKSILVEGGRKFKILSSFALDSRNVDKYKDIKQTENQYQGQFRSQISERLNHALMLLFQKGQQVKVDHSDEVTKWHQNGQGNPFPACKPNPLAQLFSIFNDLFPDVNIKLENGDRIQCIRNNSGSYSVDGLSDGEKQVLALIADVGLLSPEDGLILVDEPELNLHPHLASNLWDMIEGLRPNATFIYATHSIEFASRPSIDKLATIDNNSKSGITVIENASDIPIHQLKLYIGHLPGIVRHSKILIVEGSEKSFDSHFYKTIIGSNNFEIIPGGDCESIQSIARGNALWKKISSNAIITPVIDRDFRHDTKIKRIESHGAIVLDLHEAESYLCHPDILFDAIEASGASANTISKSEIISHIVRYAGACRSKTSFFRTLQQFSIPTPDYASALIPKENTNDSIIEHFKISVENWIQEGFANQTNIIEIFQSELQTLNNAIENGDIELILKLIPGKELYYYLCKNCTPFKSPINYLHFIQNKLEISDYSHINSLRQKILSKLEIITAPADLHSTEANGSQAE